TSSPARSPTRWRVTAPPRPRTSPSSTPSTSRPCGGGGAGPHPPPRGAARRLPPVRGDEAALLQARAWAAVAAGDLPGASALLDEAAERGRQRGDLVGGGGGGPPPPPPGPAAA